MGVIKTDAYGHGAVQIGRELERLPYVFGMAAATAEEALILRECGIKKPVLVLGYVFPYAYEELIKNEVSGWGNHIPFLHPINPERTEKPKAVCVPLSYPFHPPLQNG